MSTSPSRYVVVDDASPLISYQGPWSTNIVNTTTDYGTYYNSTLHVLDGSGNFAFNFTGNRGLC